MDIWSFWLGAIQAALQFLATDAGLGSGMAIVLFTLALRLTVLPVSWSSAYRGCLHQKRLRALQPHLQRLKERYKDQPDVLARKTLELYRERNVALFEGRALLGTLVQMPVFLGMLQTLRRGAEASRFLWISSLAKPDIWLAIVAGVTTAIMVAANPDLPESARVIMIAVPTIIAFAFALKFSSALALYWVTSNTFSAVHTFAVHYVLGRRIRNGAVRL